MERFSDLKQGLQQAWHSVNDGWRQLMGRTSDALTRFAPSTRKSLPKPSQDNDGDDAVVAAPVATSGNWGLLAGDVFEDDEKLVVRLEVPGMRREDFDLEVRSDLLVVRGEKRLEEEHREGHYRVRQCAYGHFHRTFPLPVAVDTDHANAQYDSGVLRVELPKRSPTPGRRIRIQP